VVGGRTCRFGSEDGSVWLVELSHVDGAATLSSGGVVGSREGQGANSGSGAGPRSLIHSTSSA